MRSRLLAAVSVLAPASSFLVAEWLSVHVASGTNRAYVIRFTGWVALGELAMEVPRLFCLAITGGWREAWAEAGSDGDTFETAYDPRRDEIDSGALRHLEADRAGGVLRAFH